MTRSKQSKQSTTALISKEELAILRNALAKKRLYFWVQKHWRIRDNQPLDFVKYAYLKEIYQLVVHDAVLDVVFKKAAQLGLSEFLMAVSFFVTDTMGKNVGYFFPAQSQLNDFVTMRADPVVENSNYLKSITARGANTGKTKYSDNKGMKRVRNAFVIFRGAQNPNQITSIPLDVTILDERDRFNPAAVPMIEKRLNNSDLAWCFNASTPTFPGKGVDEEMDDTDQRQWHIECPGCKKDQILSYHENVDEDEGLIVCSSSKCPYIFKQMDIQSGYWKAKNPRATRIGYELTGLLSPTLYNNDMKRLRKIIKSVNSDNLLKVQEAYNQDLGITYKSGDTTITDEILDACNRDYTLPFDMKQLKGAYAGLDIGKKSNLIVMQDDQATGKPKCIAFAQLRDVATELPVLMEMYDIRALVVDAMPEQNLVANLLLEYPGRMYACNYDYIKIVDHNFFKWYDSRVSAHRTGSLDEMFGMIRNQQIMLPRHAEFIPGLYEQMKNQDRVLELIRGIEMYVYEDNGKPDHYAHALNYALMARLRVPAILDPTIGTRNNTVDETKVGKKKNKNKKHLSNSAEDREHELTSSPDKGFNKTVF